MDILRIENLCTFFPITGGVFGKVTGYIKAVNDVSLYIKEGEVVSVVGESGCGKSTLGLSTLGLAPVTSGSIHLQNNIIDVKRQDSWAPFRKDFQIIFQDPFSSLNPKHTVKRILSEPLLLHKINTRKNVSEGAAHLMGQVGLPSDYLRRFPHEFSGGQRQRIAIARVIGVKPKMIVCDEVVSALDVSVQAQIIQLLLKLKKEMSLSLMFISHDLSLVKAISDRVYVMYLGKIVESAPANELFAKPKHPYTKALMDSIPTLNRTKRPLILGGDVPSPLDLPSGCVFKSRCTYAQEKCGARHPDLLAAENREVACYFPLDQR